MTKEEKAKYQKYATFCMKTKTPVLFNGHKYRVLRMCFSFNSQDNECLTLELADLNGCDSLITAGLDEVYEENNREEEADDDRQKEAC